MLNRKKFSSKDILFILLAGFLSTLLLLNTVLSEPVKEDFTPYLQEYQVNDSKNVTKLVSENNSKLHIENGYLYRKDYRPYLEEDAIILKPEKGTNKPSITAVLDLKESDTPVFGIEAINAALLINRGAKWLQKDCGKSRLLLEARKESDSKDEIYESISKEFIVDNKPVRNKIDLSRFSGEQVELKVRVEDYNDCTSKENQAVYLKELYLKSS